MLFRQKDKDLFHSQGKSVWLLVTMFEKIGAVKQLLFRNSKQRVVKYLVQKRTDSMRLQF